MTAPRATAGPQAPTRVLVSALRDYIAANVGDLDLATDDQETLLGVLDHWLAQRPASDEDVNCAGWDGLYEELSVNARRAFAKGVRWAERHHGITDRDPAAATGGDEETTCE